MGGMAGAPLSDDVALCSAAIAGLCQLLVSRGLLRPHELTLVAGAAGLSEGQAGLFARGELTLPPHQALVLVVAAFGRLRVIAAAAAESRASSAAVPVAAESSLAGAKAEVEALRRDFGSWRFELPSGWKSLGTPKVKLAWKASHTGDWPDVYGATAAELRSKLGGVESALAADEKIQAQYLAGGTTARMPAVGHPARSR
jgi:hypothetical protein